MTQWPRFDSASDLQSDESIRAGIQFLGNFLNTDTRCGVIRLHIDSQSGTGHQSASLHLLRRLIAPADSPYKGFGFARIVEVYYSDEVDSTETLDLLLGMLPELKGKTQGKLYNTALIKLLNYDEKPPDREVFLGFTGGLDDAKGVREKLWVQNFLCLQPFGWPAPNQMMLDGHREAISLEESPFLGQKAFRERAYFYPAPALTDENWNYYLNSENADIARKASVIQWLTQDEQLQKVNLCPTYSIRDPDGTQKSGVCPMGSPARDRIVQIMAGFSKMLLKEGKDAKPVLILNFDNYAPKGLSGFDWINHFLDGGPLDWESACLQTVAQLGNKRYLTREERSRLVSAEKNLRRYEARKKNFSAFKDIRSVFAPDPNLALIKRVVDDLVQHKQAIGFVQLGRVPFPLYAYFMSKAQLPAIFEGQNNANLALTLGEVYLSVPHPGDVTSENVNTHLLITRYPSRVRGDDNFNQFAEKCLKVARQISQKLEDGSPATILGDFMADQRDGEGMKEYFRLLGEYYRNSINDKFALALLYFANSLGISPSQQGNQRELLLSADDHPLDTLFDELQSQIQRFDEVNLVPGVFSQGGISDLYRRLLPTDGSLLLQKPVLERAPPDPGEDLQAVILRGVAPSMQPGSAVSLRFTLLGGSISSAAEFTEEHSWTPEGLPWIVFEKPFVRMNVADGALPVTGSVGGTVSGTDLEIAMDLPLTNDQTVFRGEFAQLKTIDAFLALAGGVDITAELPAPLRALTSLGVRGVEFAYNHKALSLDYISFRLETGQPWPFLWFSLEHLTIEIGVMEPGDSASRAIAATVTGDFALGSGEAPPTITLGASLPDWNIWGQLGDVPLTIDDLIDLFHLGITPRWPEGPLPRIAVFTFSYGIQSGDYAVYSSIDLDWPIRVGGQEILRIVSMALNLIGDSVASIASLSGFLIILPDSAKIGLSLTALYMGEQQGWRFEGRQISGTISITALLATYLHWDSPFQLDIENLELLIETATDSFEFAGRVIGEWDPPLQDGVTFRGELRARIGYNGGSETLGPDLVRVGKAEMPLLFAADGRPLLFLPASGGSKQSGWFGEVSLDLIWNGIELTLFYKFDPTYKVFGITWGILTGRIEEKEIAGKKHQIATLQFTETTTLGSMVETMVSWLTGAKFALATPWSALNSISLNRLALVYDFTAGTVSFDVAVGPLELGIARIETISLNYRSDAAKPAENGVIITLKGSFLWQSDPQQPLSWDAARPETTQGPPGAGNKYLDLRLLALGQHVLVEGMAEKQTVQQAIDLMRKLPLPEPGERPAVKLDAGSSWLIGAEFGVLRLEEDEEDGYFLTLQVVFNDPRLYGLRLKLAGKAAKLLTGLDFQILYRQVSETVGVYQAEITLPTEMRRLSIGAYTLTLPVFGIAVYTNGDFQLDLGFPWNADFSRSFSIEALIFPGIPLLGSAGLYFGKLSSAATSLVPATTKGLFEPVLVFGFGAQMGFGKSLEYGVLKAGFSLTIVGLLEGVLAKWNPYAPALSDAPWPRVSDAQIEGEYYFWLRGTLGISGRLYGSVDFSVIKADVTVQIMLLVQITFESYQPLVLTVQAAVDVSVTLYIDLGLVKINISLTFSLQIKETFTILSSGNPPWSVAAPARPGLLRAPLVNRLRAWREMQVLLASTSRAVMPNWSNLAPAISPVGLRSYLAPAFTVAGDAATRPDEQEVCAVALLFIESVPPVTRDTHSSPLKARGQLADTSFELLCKQVLRWVIAAMQDRRLSAEDVDRLVVSDQQLLSWLTLLSATDFSLPTEDIDTFLSAQFRVLVQASSTVDIEATFFPLAPDLVLNIPDYGTWRGYTYSFAQYNIVSTDFLARLRSYFNELAVQVQRKDESPQAAAQPSSNAPLSVASFVFGDYFLLLCRQMLQAARSALRDFTYALSPGITTGGIVTWVNETGNLGGAFTLADLFAANPTHPLRPQRTLVLEERYRIPTAGESFVSIATALGLAFTPTDLALSNAAHPTLLRPGAQVHYPGQPAYSIRAGDDLLSVARHYRVRLTDLLNQAGLLEQEDLLRGSAELFVPSITYQALAVDSLMGIAHLEAYGGAFTAAQLAFQNAGRALLRPGKEVTYPGKPLYVIQDGDCLGDLANSFEVSLTELLERTDLLRRPDVLAPAAVLALPPFAASTRPAETLQSVARRLNTTIAVLAASPANLLIQDLFDASARSVLDLPHLPQFRVKELLEEIQRSLSLQQLSGMTSRYYLHGLRLPTAGITPRYRGMWVREKDGTLTLPPQAGLYALSGQQFPLPTIQGQPFVFYLLRSVNLAWLTFVGDNPTRLTLTIEANSTDNRRLEALRGYTRGNRLPIELAELGQQAQLTRTPATYSLTSALSWQAGAAVSLPYGRPPDGIPALRIWQLPMALTDLPDPHTRALKPRFRMRVARYDEASGATVHDDLASYGWATSIAFTVKKVPVPASTSASAALRATCEIVGASGSALVLLERLLSEMGEGEDPLDTLLLGYAPNQASTASPGIQTDAPETVTMGIAQVNLSTQTRPTRTQVSTAAAGPTLLNSRAEFLRLLWEASITRAGGFYLYYYNAESKGGLPERIFNDKGEATLTLIVLYRRPSAVAQQNCLSPAMNALATAEPLETAQAVIFAEADPMRPAPRIPAQETDTLFDLAFRYYGDVAELARDNADVLLAEGAVITVRQGLYEVPPTGVEPGGNLARIATHFGTTIQAIKDANPRLTVWPDPLPLFQAIRLPRLQVTVGTGPGGRTLGQLALFYGEALSALAADNQQTPGLFAAGQQLVIAGGPVVSRPSVPAGVLALETRRPVPPAVPADPAQRDYARLSLLHLYTLLSFQVSENAEFRSSVLSLPAGPTTEGAANTHGKVRIPRELAPGDLWVYRQALPYPQLIRQASRSVDGLPDPAESPYRALGRLLQLDMAWQDLYGNRLMTTLSHPAVGDSGPLNRRPYLTGYTDLLLGLNQWPSISAGWQVLPGGLPRLEVLLSFDDSPYQGLLAIATPTATTLLASFTLPLDPDSAIELANYRLDIGTLQRARLLSDGTTVELTVSALPEQTTCTLTVGNMKVHEQDLFLSGQASCHYPDDPAQRSSTLQEQARRDLAVYTSLYYQLSDPNGISLTLQTSLLKGGTLPLPNPGALLAWIGAIYTFLADRAEARKQIPLPQKEYRLSSDIPPGWLNEQQIFALTLALRITRTSGLVAGDLATVADLREVTTEIAPLVQHLGDTSETLGLTVFASRFEEALTVADAYQLKVATGVDRFRRSPARSASTLWAVRLSLGPTDTTGLSLSVANPGVPALFAPRPVSNRLASQYHVPIYDYRTGRGIDFTIPGRFLDFVAIDLDLWVRQVFAELDGVLTPEFTAAIQILDLRKHMTCMADLLAAKKELARLASAWMIPVFANERTNAGTIQRAFEQQMLQQLSNAYTTRAGLQFQARVRANIQPPPGQLLGTIIQHRENNESSQRDVALTSPKLLLQTGSSNPLAFLLTAPDIVLDAQGQVMPSLSLDLSYEASQIEHQIGKLPGIEDYLASSWLSFILPVADSPLSAPLGKFPVPLVLRTYPDSPSMLEQLGTFPHQPGDPLRQLTLWTYGFTYSLPFHYPQDTLIGMVYFNVPDSQPGDFPAAFNDLAEFITVFPAVQRDLREVLATIDAGTTDEQVLTTAAIAAASFRDMVERIVKSAQQDEGLVRPPASAVMSAQANYAFRIKEGCVQREGVAALLVTLHGQPPAGLAAPQVLIDPATYEVQPFTCAGEDCGGKGIQGDFCFWYRHRETGQPLSALEGQRIQERQLVLGGLDLFAAQDASAWVLLQRNEGLAEPFVYTTGRVMFANPFHPTSDSRAQVINLATIGSGTPPHPITRSFAQHLEALFTTLLQETTQPALIVQAEIHYEYAIHPELSVVPLQILLQPPHHVSVAGEGSDTLGQMIATWEQAIQRWGTAHAPQKTSGTLWFDLTIMSELTSQPLPLLRLRLLCLPLSTLDPPLW
ncbi:MAG TPA: LysM peptidoglycan-binding domain-containing protein [Ktedonobacteraceae bacterium]|nr:LysM peptidoglycan-binding domain-containing protein [Ktedonobacteraceae bacterium]